MSKISIIGLGEIAVDLLGEQKFAGGASSNFAQFIADLGYSSGLISAVGKDEHGTFLVNQLKQRKVSTEFVQIKKIQTGTVTVVLNGIEPEFTVSEKAAWDSIEWNKDLEKLAQKIELVCFGSIAQRNKISRNTIQNFLKKCTGKKLFDVNIRAKWNAHLVSEVIHPCLKFANILKINEQESFYFKKWLKQKDSVKLAKKLFTKYKNLELIAFTQGENGCELFTKKQKTQVSGFSVKAVDTTGCGDSFSAGLAIAFLEKKNLEEIGEFANACGALAATKMGATPELSRKQVEKFIEQKRII
ncbi:MAG: carbohydrate kinase [Candidatus Diapherotrites archaeon]|nr:carbohydrate kinase [Candidatus Diapherotrites archaeon]